jgi:hypothetical protein
MKSNDSIKIQKLTLWVHFQSFAAQGGYSAIDAVIDGCQYQDCLTLLDWESEDLQLITRPEKDAITERLEIKGEV